MAEKVARARSKVLTMGYASLDHMIKIKTPARVGYTSLISNSTCTTANYGGCSVNISYALARLGIAATPVLRVGADWDASGFHAFLDNSGVGTDAIEVLPDEATPVSYMIEDPEGQHICLYYPGSMDGRYAHALPDDLFDGVRLGVITVASRPDNEAFFAQCATHGVPVVFGMKCDFDAFPPDFLERLLKGSRIVFANEGERRYIEGEFGLASIEDLFAYEPSIIITTRGESGSSYAAKMHDGSVDRGQIGCCPVRELLDTTGGGDAYISGFLYGYLRGYGLLDCCGLGAALSAFVLEKEGCCTGVPTEPALLERFEAFRASAYFDRARKPEKGRNV